MDRSIPPGSGPWSAIHRLAGSLGVALTALTLFSWAGTHAARAQVEEVFDPFAPEGSPTIAAPAGQSAAIEVEARLIARQDAIVPGEAFTVGLLLEHGPGWHTYYKYPGIGQPTSLSWSLPEGFEAGPIQWPVPEVTPFFGEITYSYHDRIVLPVTISAPASLSPGGSVTLKAAAKWLQCKEACVQDGAEVELILPVAAAATPVAEHAALFAAADALLPAPSDAWTFSAGWDEESGTIRIGLTAADDAQAAALAPGDVYFFPDSAQIRNVESQPLEAADDGSHYSLVLQPRNADDGPPARISGVLRAKNGWLKDGRHHAIPVSLAIAGAPGATSESDAPPAPVTEAGEEAQVDEPATSDGKVSDSTRAAIAEMRSWGVQGLDGEGSGERGLIKMILFALLGGVILNIMPCVFPVLGIKIMGFVNQAGENRAKIRLHGLVFAAGVILSIWALVAVLFLVRSFGSQVGWGFQLQNPGFLAFIIALLFLFGLSLSGVFEIGASLTAVGGTLQQKSGYSGSFFSGLLTVLVATPCTGPFMGPALGYAFSVPPLHAYLVFTALAVGVALPYVTLSFFPALIGRLPRPGPWMETFKQFMAFPLYATVVWLVGVYAKVVGVSGMTWLLAGLVGGAMGAWLLGRYGTPVRKARTRWLSRAAAAATLVLLGWAAHHGISNRQSSSSLLAAGGSSNATIQSHGMTWIPFSPESVVEHRKKGRTVFIDFTADW